MAWTDILQRQPIRAAPVQKIVNVLKGTPGQAEPIYLNQLGDANYSLTLRHLATGATGGKALLVQDPVQTSVPVMRLSGVSLSPSATAEYAGYFSTRVTFGTDTHRDANQVLIHKTITAGPLVSLLGVEMNNNAATGAGDTGAITAVMRMQAASGAANAGRALEGQVLRLTGSGKATLMAAELGVHTEVGMLSYADVASPPTGADTEHGSVGAYVYATTNVDGAATGVRANTGVKIGGNAGFKQGILYVDTNATTKLFEVDQSGNTTLRGSLIMSSAGQKFLGTYHDSTLINRPYFQTSNPNSATYVGAIPSGTGTQSEMQAWNNATPTNGEFATIRAEATLMSLRSDRAGSGTYRDLAFFTSNTESFRIRAADQLVQFTAGSAALGGGAGATLGTIGGSGPTTAAQARWQKIFSGGVAGWIPVWS